MRRLIILAGLLMAVAAVAPPALAHKIIVNTFVAGDTIEGEVGFSDGAMATDTPVTVRAPDGRVLGETRTDADGFFSFTPTEAVEHVFRADLGAGHVAEARVPVADLPAVLSGGAAPVAEAEPATTAPVEDTRAPQATLTPAMRQAIAEAVRDEVRPLWRELASYKEKNDLQTILGGIGYIVGLFGVAFYLMGRQRLKRA